MEFQGARTPVLLAVRVAQLQHHRLHQVRLHVLHDPCVTLGLRRRAEGQVCRMEGEGRGKPHEELCGKREEARIRGEGQVCWRE